MAFCACSSFRDETAVCEKKSLSPFYVGVAIFGVAAFIVDKQVNINGDGIITSMIVDRIKYDKDNGVSGNNRTSENFDNYYDSLSAFQLLIGLNGTDNKKFEQIMKSDGNNGYKYTVIGNGYIGLLLLLSFFFVVIKSYPSRMGYGMFLLFALSYLQRVYLLWPIESYIYSSCSCFL